MEKVLKTVKIIAISLIIVLISIISFIGIYTKQNSVWRKITPEFNYGIELGQSRELRYALDTTEQEKNVYVDSEGNILGEVKEETTTVEESENSEESSTEANESTTETQVEQNSEDKPNYATEVRKIKANEEEAKTIENFQKAKKIIQQRLENEDVYEYNIRLDTITGNLILEVQNNDDVSIINTAVTSVGKFEVIDEQTGIILMDNSDLKTVQAGMYQEETGYQACLQISFNKEGTEKLKDISNKYRQVVNDAGESEIDYISIVLDGQTISTTYFGEELSNGTIQIPLGNPTTDSETMNQTLNEVKRIANMINEEKLPVVYSLSSDRIVESRITSNDKLLACIIFGVLVIAISIVLIIKFKSKGAILAILSIGFIALLNLLVRYTQTYVTLNSTIAFVGVVVLNYLFIKFLLLENSKNEIIKEAFLGAMKKYYLTIVPVLIVAVVLTFVSNIAISSIGAMLFWGLILQLIYNAITILGLGLI